MDGGGVYPFARPDGSYVLAGGRADRLSPEDLAAAGAEDRVALLAYGANASPERLALKLAPLGPSVRVPVLRAVLGSFDAVYSAHVSPYGAVPATLRVCAGVELGVYVTFLTQEEIGVVSATEPNYELGELGGIELRFENTELPSRSSALAYVSRHGALLLDGSPVAVAELPAAGRRLPERNQAEILAEAGHQMEKLRASAEPFAWPDFRR